MAAYIFLGVTYGLLAETMGFSIWYPLLMAMFVYSGSVEFLALGMLVAAFNPMMAALVALMVCARHLFYGISMLDVYKGAGWRKFFLIFGMSDETFAINYSHRDEPYGVMLWVTFLDWLYWLTGACLGYAFGSILHVDIRGLEFVLTAMFTSIFMDQLMKEKNRVPALIGIIPTAVCLALVGNRYFILPSMLCILLLLTLMRKRWEK
ncbi:MAG: AzlC family ABC transporter permease [Fibrobacter sp.]|nr:AzlC family ABC transporter permease [Fibrobacter sp.]